MREVILLSLAKWQEVIFVTDFFLLSSYSVLRDLIKIVNNPSIAGRPRPKVSWYLDNKVIDESYEIRPDGVTVNHLLYPNINREHLNARLVCVATNTNLAPPLNQVVVLDVNCKGVYFYSMSTNVNNFYKFPIPVKPTNVHFLTKEKYLSADHRYDIECRSSGSRPDALITWWKSQQQMKRIIKHVSIIQFPIQFHNDLKSKYWHHLPNCLINNTNIISFRRSVFE